MASGRKGKLYRNTGTHAAPVLVEIPEARDVDFPMAPDKIDDSDRGSDFKKYTDGQIDLAINAKLTYRNGNANCTAIRNALLNGTIIEFFALDGPSDVTGSEGIRFFGKVFTNNMNQPLTDGQTVDIEIAPAYYEEASAVVQPSWYEVPA